ncbi:DUF5992 family protein [Rheinheimera soli]|uniref:DUF5992 family protein n=1 Tax=Rheinheimera soli TaxID=443616 RepID=UPI001E461627|nr:DUF5992 family protein [Rheinheimera soli]
MLSVKKIYVLFFGFFMSMTCLAWDGITIGKIHTIDVTDAENFAFRITFTNGEKFCGIHTWAFLNKSDSNYDTYVSVLLAAKMAEKTVSVYTTSSGGYCKIGYITVV